MSKLLDKLVGDARAELGKDAAKKVDWDTVDAALFERIAREREAERARFVAPAGRPAWHAWTWTLGTGVVAAAVAVTLFAGRTREGDGTTLAPGSDVAGAIAAIEPANAAVLVDGAPAIAGASLKLGDAIETREGAVVVERPGKLTLVLEPGSRAVVTHVRGALVLALERGAVEAQVAPVAAGEAFAVDVGGARVAVHGTHLRVAREGERAVVDLNEGVVSVGEPPREGSLLGVLVNAPAHVEFASLDPVGTLTQTHDPSAVRPPRARSASLVRPPVIAPKTGTPARSATGEPHAAGDGRTSVQPPRLYSASPVQSAAPPSGREAAIADAVRACMAERPRADNVSVVVQTALHLELAEDGTVRTARFEPPVAPDVNACAAPAIYRAKFAAGEPPIVIPIDFSY